MNGYKGFSLVELLVVISIMGILVGISVPGIIEWSKNAKYKEAAQLAASALRQAKGQAINLNQSVPVTFFLDSGAANNANTVQISGVHPTPVKFPSGIEIRGTADCDLTTGNVIITFNPSGGAGTNSGAYICIYDGVVPKYRTGYVNRNTGRVVLQKRQGSAWK